MNHLGEKSAASKGKTRSGKKSNGMVLHETFAVGDIEVSLWLGKTQTGIRYPQFSLCRVFTSDNTGRQIFTGYYDDTNEGMLQDAISQAVIATRRLREEILRGELPANAKARKTPSSVSAAA